MRRPSEDQHVEILAAWIQSIDDTIEVLEAFNEKYGNEKKLSRST